MNKIFNWTFGACFRTLGRFLAIFLVGLLLVFIGSKIGLNLPDWLILNVNAATKENWGLELTPIPRMNVYDAQNMSQLSVTSQVVATQAEGNTFTKEWNVWDIGEKTYGANGYMWEFPSQLEHTPNYLYSYQLGVCANKSIGNANISIFAGKYGSKENTDIYSQVSLNSMNSQVFPDWYENNCYIIYGYYVPSYETAWTHLRINSPSSTISSLGVYVFSFDIKPVGIWTSGIKNIIDNSGFASADSVEQVQQSVNQVQQEVQQTNDTITDSTSPDVSGMTDLAGYLPPGPLDSVLNLPLSILNSLNTKLSSSCSALSLTLPFVNLPLNIPCLSTIFNQINGLNTLFEFIGVICGALIMYSYLTYLYNWVDDVTSLRHNKARLFGAKSDVDNWGGV